MGNNSVLIRLISLLLTGSFLCQELAYSAPPITTPFASDPIDSFQVPIDFCALKEIHKGLPGKPFIIHIQDAHSNLSGQENLAKTLDEIMKKYGVSYVLVEGGGTDGTLDPLKKLAEPAIIKRVAKRLLIEGKLAGEEYLNLTSDHKMKILGIEDMTLYKKSVENYAKLADKRESILDYLTLINGSVEKIKNKLYPPEIISYEKEKQKDAGSDVTAFKLKELLELARVKQISLENFPSIQRLSVLQEREKEIDFNLANLEQAALAEEIEKKGGGEDLSKYLSIAGQFKKQKLSQCAYFQNIFEIAKEKNVPLDKYPNLIRYNEYLKSFTDVDLDQVMDVYIRLEDRVYASWLPDSGARLVRAIDRYLGILGIAYRIQMSTKDFNFFKVNELDFSTASYQAFLNRKLIELGYFEDVIPYKNILEQGKKALENFYDSVGQRDLAFVENTEKILGGENQKIAILISGGYHTSHLKKLFQEKGFSYAVLTPIVTSETNQQKYEKLLLSGIRKETKKAEVIHGETKQAQSPVSLNKEGVRAEGAVMGSRLADTVASFAYGTSDPSLVDSVKDEFTKRLTEDRFRNTTSAAESGARLVASTSNIDNNFSAEEQNLIYVMVLTSQDVQAGAFAAYQLWAKGQKLPPGTLTADWIRAYVMLRQFHIEEFRELRSLLVRTLLTAGVMHNEDFVQLDNTARELAGEDGERRLQSIVQEATKETPVVPELSPEDDQVKIDKIVDKIRRDEDVTITFICTANMNRSAAAHILAENEAQTMGKSHVKIVSGGLITSQLPNYDGQSLQGASVQPEYLPALQSIGVRKGVVEKFKSEQITADKLSADLIVVASSKHKEMLLTQFPNIPNLADRTVLFTEMHPDLQRFGDEMPDPQNPKDNLGQAGLVALIKSTVIARLFGSAPRASETKNSPEEAKTAEASISFGPASREFKLLLAAWLHVQGSQITVQAIIQSSGPISGNQELQSQILSKLTGIRSFDELVSRVNADFSKVPQNSFYAVIRSAGAKQLDYQQTYVNIKKMKSSEGSRLSAESRSSPAQKGIVSMGYEPVARSQKNDAARLAGGSADDLLPENESAGYRSVEKHIRGFLGSDMRRIEIMHAWTQFDQLKVRDSWPSDWNWEDKTSSIKLRLKSYVTRLVVLKDLVLEKYPASRYDDKDWEIKMLKEMEAKYNDYKESVEPLLRVSELVPWAEIVRFSDGPQRQATELELNNYWRNQADTREFFLDTLDRLDRGETLDFEAFFREAHRRAVVGNDQKNPRPYYKKKDGTYVEPGGFRESGVWTSRYPDEADQVAQMIRENGIQDPYADYLASMAGVHVVQLPRVAREARPRNVGIRHIYPEKRHVGAYLKALSDLLREFVALKKTSLNSPVLILKIAEFYQFGVNARPFDQINNSLFTNFSNGMLRSIGLQGISHSILDHAAMRLQPKGFAALFWKEVSDANQDDFRFRPFSNGNPAVYAMPAIPDGTESAVESASEAAKIFAADPGVFEEFSEDLDQARARRLSDREIKLLAELLSNKKDAEIAATISGTKTFEELYEVLKRFSILSDEDMGILKQRVAGLANVPFELSTKQFSSENKLLSWVRFLERESVPLNYGLSANVGRLSRQELAKINALAALQNETRLNPQSNGIRSMGGEDLVITPKVPEGPNAQVSVDTSSLGGARLAAKRDYYKVLGLKRDASADEIKKAHKRIALANHPDRNPGDQSAIDRFKEAAEAFEVLDDPDKKALYDQTGDLNSPELQMYREIKRDMDQVMFDWFKDSVEELRVEQTSNLRELEQKLDRLLTDPGMKSLSRDYKTEALAIHAAKKKEIEQELFRRYDHFDDLDDADSLDNLDDLADEFDTSWMTDEGLATNELDQNRPISLTNPGIEKTIEGRRPGETLEELRVYLSGVYASNNAFAISKDRRQDIDPAKDLVHFYDYTTELPNDIIGKIIDDITTNFSKADSFTLKDYSYASNDGSEKRILIIYPNGNNIGPLNYTKVNVQQPESVEENRLGVPVYNPVLAVARLTTGKEDEAVDRLRDIYGKLSSEELREIGQLVENDFRMLGMAVASRNLKNSEDYALEFQQGYALVSSQNPNDVTFFGKTENGGKGEKIGSITLTEEQVNQGHADLDKLKGRSLEEVVLAAKKEIPEFVQAADQTIRTVLSAKDGAPVVLNIIGEDVLVNNPMVQTMVEGGVSFLQTRNIYLRFGKIVGDKFVADETYHALNSGSVPEGQALESYIGTRDSLARLNLPPQVGIGIVEKQEGRIIRLLDTFVKVANIKRNKDIDKIRQNISSVADPLRVKMADPNKLLYLNEIPSDFNERKDTYLKDLEPFTILTLKFTIEEIIGYAQMVTRAVGTAA